LRYIEKNDYFGYQQKYFQIPEIAIYDISKCLLGYLKKRMQYYGYPKYFSGYLKLFFRYPAYLFPMSEKTNKCQLRLTYTIAQGHSFLVLKISAKF